MLTEIDVDRIAEQEALAQSDSREQWDKSLCVPGKSRPVNEFVDVFSRHILAVNLATTALFLVTTSSLVSPYSRHISRRRQAPCAGLVALKPKCLFLCPAFLPTERIFAAPRLVCGGYASSTGESARGDYRAGFAPAAELRGLLHYGGREPVPLFRVHLVCDLEQGGRLCPRDHALACCAMSNRICSRN